MVLAKLAQRVAVVAQFVEGDEGERDVGKITAKGGTGQLSHDFSLAVIRGNQIEIAGAAGIERAKSSSRRMPE